MKQHLVGRDAQKVPGPAPGRVLYTRSSLPSRRSHLSRSTLLQVHLGWRRCGGWQLTAEHPWGRTGGTVAGVFVGEQGGEEKRMQKTGWTRHTNPRRPLDRATWWGCGKVPGAQDSLQHQSMVTCSSPICLYLPSQGQPCHCHHHLQLPWPLLCQHRCQKSPAPRGQSVTPAGLHFHPP